MEQNRNSYQVWWLYDQTITAPATIVVPLGCNVIGAFAPAGSGVALVRDLRYFAFSFYCAYTTASISLQVDVGASTAAMRQWFLHPHSGTLLVDTLYNVAPPLGGTSGCLIIATQFLRLSLVVAGAGNVSNVSFTARAWKE